MTIFGAAAVSTMALAYGLEKRHHLFVALFAAGCACSSSYGFLIGSLPFGAIEALWSVIALQRFCAGAQSSRRPGQGGPRLRADLTVSAHTIEET